MINDPTVFKTTCFLFINRGRKIAVDRGCKSNGLLHLSVKGVKLLPLRKVVFPGMQAKIAGWLKVRRTWEKFHLN